MIIDRLRMADEYDKLALCTESLGFESFDVRMDLNGAEELALAKDVVASMTMTTSPPLVRSRSLRSEKYESKFPPPLTWLTVRDGRWRHAMRAVKEDGRLVLTEVKVEQPPKVFPSRQDGRLRMQLIQSNHEQRERWLRMQLVQSDYEEQEEVVEEEEEAERWELLRGLQRCHEPVTASNSQFWPRSMLLDAGIIGVV